MFATVIMVLIFVYPFHDIASGNWDHWPVIAYFLAVTLPFCWLYLAILLVTELLFDSFLICNAGVYRVGIGGKLKRADRTQVVSYEHHATGIRLCVAGGRNLFFDFKHYIPDSSGVAPHR